MTKSVFLFLLDLFHCAPTDRRLVLGFHRVLARIRFCILHFHKQPAGLFAFHDAAERIAAFDFFAVQLDAKMTIS